jgi:hypothetical protein
MLKKQRSYADLSINEKAVLKYKLLNNLSYFIRFFFKEVEGN